RVFRTAAERPSVENKEPPGRQRRGDKKARATGCAISRGRSRRASLACQSRNDMKPLVDLLIHQQSARVMGGPVMLIIRDGWGINPGGGGKRGEKGGATLLASPPSYGQLSREYPCSRLHASVV